MNNLSSYCGLVDAKIRASDKDLPLQVTIEILQDSEVGKVVSRLKKRTDTTPDAISSSLGFEDSDSGS